LEGIGVALCRLWPLRELDQPLGSIDAKADSVASTIPNGRRCSATNTRKQTASASAGIARLAVIARYLSGMASQE